MININSDSLITAEIYEEACKQWIEARNITLSMVEFDIYFKKNYVDTPKKWLQYAIEKNKEYLRGSSYRFSPKGLQVVFSMLTIF